MNTEALTDIGSHHLPGALGRWLWEIHQWPGLPGGSGAISEGWAGEAALGFSRVSRRVGSGGKSLIFTHRRTWGKFSTIFVS